MLNLGMELEADLGIDSIKRVEILSAMQEKVPSLPEVETSKMATLNTLQEIVDYMQSLLGPVSAPAIGTATPGLTGGVELGATDGTVIIGVDTVEANLQLGFLADERDFGIAAAMLLLRGVNFCVGKNLLGLR